MSQYVQYVYSGRAYLKTSKGDLHLLTLGNTGRKHPMLKELSPFKSDLPWDLV